MRNDFKILSLLDSVGKLQQGTSYTSHNTYVSLHYLVKNIIAKF